MRSIRLSLVVSFLVLLALALGTVSVIVYRTTERNLQDKQERMAELLHEAHRAKLDAVLLSEATTLANVVKMQGESRKPNQPVLQALRVLLNYQSIDSRTATPLWLLQTTRPVRDYLWVMSFKFKISDLVLPDPEGQLTQYAQINGTRGAEWHSESLEERSLPFEVKQFAGRYPESGALSHRPAPAQQGPTAATADVPATAADRHLHPGRL